MNALVDERSAAVLLGLPVAELRQLSQQVGLGRARAEGESAPMPKAEPSLVFTDEELRKLSFVAARFRD